MSFTMGHKALILNALRGEDTIDAAQTTIIGFCDFLVANITPVAVVAASAGSVAAPVFTAVLPAGFALGDAVNVELRFNQGGRYISEYTSNFIKQGDTFIFQAKPLAATDAALGTSIQVGWLAYKALFELGAAPVLEVTATLAAVTVTGQNDFCNVESMSIKNVPAGSKTAPAIENSFAVASGSLNAVEGNGQGKFIEETIRTANYTNMDPYANKPHGSDSVDVRGSYKLYEFTGASVNGGWAPHENLGTAIADQNVTSGPQKYTIYANEADAALVAALDAAIV